MVVAFLDAHTTYAVGGRPARRRRVINGRPAGQGDAARTIRRLRSGRFTTVSAISAERLLSTFHLSIDELRVWAAHEGTPAFLRG